MGKAPCCDKTGLNKGPWTAEEDQKLIAYIQKYGHGKWRTLPKNAGLKRCGKSCRLRWTNYLRPDIKRGRFSLEEEETIIQLHSLLGNKWSAIAARLPGRTDNEIKNYWNTRIRKRLLRMGIDPVTHAPRLDNLDMTTLLWSSLGDSSSQLNNFPNILGMGYTSNQNLLHLATFILSSQHKNPEPLLCDPNHQNLNENLQSPFNIPFCVSDINRGDQLSTANDQIMQFNHVETAPNFSSLQNSSLPSLCQVAANCIEENNNHFNYSNMSRIDTIPATKETFDSSDVGKVQDFCFGSSLSSPMTGLTTLNSSSTTYFKDTNEDERDGFGKDNAVICDLAGSSFVGNKNPFTMLI